MQTLALNKRREKREEIVADVFVGPSVICFCHVFLLGSLRFNVIYPSELRLRDLLLLPSPRPVLRFVYAKSTNHRMKYKQNGKQKPQSILGTY